MRVGSVIDRAFDTLRREWRIAVLIGAATVGGIVFFFIAAFGFFGLSIGFDATVPEDVDVARLAIGGIVFFLLAVAYSLVLYVLNGISVRAAYHGPPEGTPWDGLGSHAGPALWGSLRILGWSLILGVVVAVVFGGLAVVGAVLADDGGGLFAFLFVVLMIGFVLASLFVLPVVLVAVALVYAQERPVLAALGDGFRLVGRAYWPSLGAALLLFVFSLVPIVGGLLVTVLAPPYQASLLIELESA
ncbi:MAG: hypothetical protein AB1Z57_08095 [Acidimicrobiia bacterium]